MTILKNLKNKNSGFTLLEVLMVVAIIGILAAIVAFAINPKKQLGDAYNAERKAAVRAIATNIYLYSTDNGGSLPAGDEGVEIPVSDIENPDLDDEPVEICYTAQGTNDGDDSDCGNSDLVDLYPLTKGKKYMIVIPIDPAGALADGGTGYTVIKDSDGHITVVAPHSVDDDDTATVVSFTI